MLHHARIRRPRPLLAVRHGPLVLSIEKQSEIAPLEISELQLIQNKDDVQLGYAHATRRLPIASMRHKTYYEQD